MNCPNCNQAMQEGYFCNFQQPIQWIPIGSKPSTWITQLAKGAIPLGGGSYWRFYKASAYFCPHCQMVLTPVRQD